MSEFPASPPAYSNWAQQPPALAGPLHVYWLTRPGALTTGLRQLGTLGLRVVREQASQLSPDEAWVLQKCVNSPIWLREIIMSIDGTDLVFARSFTPLTASQGLWSGMRSLHTRPLADMLYHDPAISRSGFYQCRMQEGQPIYQSLGQAFQLRSPPAEQVLARCSVFRREQAPLLVAESFLPAFWELARAAAATHDAGQASTHSLTSAGPR